MHSLDISFFFTLTSPPPAPLLGGSVGVSLLILDISSLSGIYSFFTCFYIFLTEKNATLRIIFIHWGGRIDAQGLIYFLYICPGSPLPLDT
jgi:hypothetical protein